MREQYKHRGGEEDRNLEDVSVPSDCGRAAAVARATVNSWCTADNVARRSST